ncbi:PhnD/SsuA/transferrin family substrate-binding protein [Shigella flexneri]
MEKKLGVKVNAFFAPDLAGVIQGMRFNKVDIAWYGTCCNGSGGWPTARSSLRPSRAGSPGYWSVLIVNKIVRSTT